MPAKLIARKREYQPPAEQEQAAPVARRPLPEADEAEPVEPGRPYQAFVENEARKFWEDMVKQPRSLARPKQQELRAAAMPILCMGLRKRSGARFLPPTVKAHMAVNVMHMHAAYRKELTRPYEGPYPVSDHIEALIQYMKDTRLAPREIPLPWHGEPKHPPIYYYIDPITRQPTPREDALICAEYVRRPWARDGYPLTWDSDIHPSLDPHGQPPPVVLKKKLRIYYRLRDRHVKIEIRICRVSWDEEGWTIMDMPLAIYKFTKRWLGAYYDEHMQVRRPHQAFVESEARKYWYETVDIGNLAKPDPQHLRGAARQFLLQERDWDRFLPPPSKAHKAVQVVHRRVDREIPLPEHGKHKHPPIYYYIDPITRQPTPRDDALIRSDYVWDSNGSRLTSDYYIHPWPGTERSGPTREQLSQKLWLACYTLCFNRLQELYIRFYWLPQRGLGLETATAIMGFPRVHFSPRPPP